jgi:hypothetical protein
VKKDKVKEKKSKKSGKRKKDKSLYEVADGVATPSKEHVSGTATPNNLVITVDASFINFTGFPMC